VNRRPASANTTADGESDSESRKKIWKRTDRHGITLRLYRCFFLTSLGAE